MICNTFILLMKPWDSYETRQIFDFDHKTPIYTKSESEINFIQCKTGRTKRKNKVCIGSSSSF